MAPFEGLVKPCGLLEGLRFLEEMGRLPRLLAITIPEFRGGGSGWVGEDVETQHTSHCIIAIAQFSI